MSEAAGALYRTGTIDVTNNSDTINGTATNWRSALTSIAVGDLLTLDFKTWYEILAVGSDTGLIIDRGYEGSTSTGVNYAILRNTSGTTNTRLAGQVSKQFNQKQLLLDQWQVWTNSSNPTETITDSHNVDREVLTLNSFEARAETAIDSVIESASAFTSVKDPLCHLLATNQPVVKANGNLVFSRNSTATYVDRYGVIKTAAIDNIREEKEGYLLEDGISESIGLPSYNNLPDLTGDFTIVVEADGFLSPNAGKLGYLWQIPVNETAVSTRGLFLARTVVGSQIIARLDNGVVNKDVVYAVTEDRNTIALVKTATQTMLYVNGVLAGSVDITGVSVTLDTSKDIKVGGRLVDANSNHYGHIKNFRVYDKALTEPQVKAISNG